MTAPLSSPAKPAAPIFIVGPPRCGTTLVAEILGSHTDIFFPSETHFYEEIRSRANGGEIAPDSPEGERALNRTLGLFRKYQYEKDWNRVEAAGFRENLEACWRECEGGLPGLFQSFMSLQAEGEGKTRWGDNTPRDVFNLERILADFPEARILLCSRDPRDFLLSYQNKWKRTWDVNQSRIRSLYHPLTTTLLWKSSIRQMGILDRLCPQENWMIVRYEDMVADPEGTVRRICKTVGIDFRDDLLDVESNNSSFEGEGSRGIFSVSVNRWKEALPRAESWFPEKFAENEMSRLNYEPGDPAEVGNPGFGRRLAFFIQFPFSLLAALRANLPKTGPILPYLFRRMAPILRRP